MMLAIIIPYYKLAFFEATLDSLANQTDQRFRLYIGDDASLEDCSTLINEYQQKIDLIYNRFEYNLGSISLTQQWERCIALTQDENWLMLLGDDDVLAHNLVEEFYKFVTLSTEEIDVIRFNLRIIDKDGELLGEEVDHEIHETAEKLLDRMLSMKETITATEFIFSRKIYNYNKGFVEFPLAWFSDYATWLNFSKNTGIYHIKKSTVYWRLSAINISAAVSDENKIQQKIKSLFLFMYFVQVNFKIDNDRLKKYTHSQMIIFFGNISDFVKIRILRKECFKFQYQSTDIVVIEFILRRLKRKKIKNLWKYLFRI